jgi:flagellin-specific chaperone FliS
MTLSSAQLDKIVEIYATAMVDSMDEKTLVEFVYETIVENMSNLSEEDILNELYAYYDEEDADSIVESVSQVV